MRKDIRTLTKFPATHPIIRRELARDDICPECGGDLDTGWECNKCQYDARDLAYPAHERELDKKYADD